MKRSAILNPSKTKFMDQNTSNKMWYWIVGLVVVVVIVYLGASGRFGGSQFSPAGGQTVKIGFITPLSGDAAALGQEEQKVVAYRVKQINDAAGESGTKFEFIYEDGKCSGNDAVSAFQKLTNIDGVKIILGA